MLGILIIAVGHPGYGRMAYNLAMTIKAIENIPVAVVHSGAALSHLDESQRGHFFDHIIELPAEYASGIHTKLHLDQLTPFDKTLYLDADMVWLSKKPSDLFKELNGISFTGITEGDNVTPNNKYYFWADPKEIMEAYKVDKLYQWRSEVLYFEKGTKVFKKARELKPDKKLKTIRMFGADIPDELYFNIATALLNIEPHTKWNPAYWMRMHGEFLPKPGLLNGQYYLLSAGSNFASPAMKKAYDNAGRVAAHKTGVQFLFPLISKRTWAPGRLKI